MGRIEPAQGNQKLMEVDTPLAALAVELAKLTCQVKALHVIQENVLLRHPIHGCDVIIAILCLLTNRTRTRQLIAGLYAH